jgi:hypothetical protein
MLSFSLLAAGLNEADLIVCYVMEAGQTVSLFLPNANRSHLLQRVEREKGAFTTSCKLL